MTTFSMRHGLFLRYLYGWYHYVRAFYKMVTKDHGAGPSGLLLAHRMGMHMRWSVDGQFRHGKFPRYMRRYP